MIKIDLYEEDLKAGKNWLRVDPGSLLGDRREEIRRRNWEKHIAKREQEKPPADEAGG
jgi:hypothetical protein